MIRLEDITVRFEEFTALKEINVHVREGEFFTFLGPSGCGKTTTLRTIAGFIQPVSGRVSVKGKDITHLPIEERNIGIVFQSYALFPTMTVRDNIAFGLKIKKLGKEEIARKVAEIAKKVDLSEEQLGKAVSQLSGGQQQRVAIARALVTEPAIICMDEPLSNLDAKLRVETRAGISKLHHQLGTTFIYVTHDQVEAMTMASRIAVMKDGLLHQIDTPQHLYDHPVNIFVAGFIGSPSMNFFESTLVEQDGKLFVDGGTFKLQVPESKKADYIEHKGKKVIFGVRPEDVYTKGYEAPGIIPAPITAQVDVSELMGNEITLYLLTGKKQFVARVDPRTHVRIGETIDMMVNMDNMHLFDPQTEKTLDVIR